MNLQFFFMNAWRWKEDLAYNYSLTEKEWKIDTSGFEDHSWKDEFERLRENRLLIAQLRYGKNGTKGKKKYDWVNHMIEYLNEYKETGNMELLVDVANYCSLEFFEPIHENAHFFAKDDKKHVKSLK